MGKTMARSMSTQSSRPLGPTLLRRLSDTAFNLRNDFTDELIFLANTSDPRAFYMSVPEASCGNSNQTVSCTDSTWARRKRWKDNGAWSWDVKVLDADVLLAATDRCGYFAEPRSLALTSLAGYSPSPHSLGPYPYGNCLPPLPPQEHAASPLCKLLGYSKRSFSSWTSTSHVDVGTEQKMCFLKLRRWWLHDCSWRRRAWQLGPEHGRLHMTIRGNRVPAFSVPKERRAVASTAVHQLRQSGKRFVAGTDAHQHLKLENLDQDAERLAQSRMCREMAHHCPTRVSGIPST